MISHTFCILDGIGERLERRLWQQGILDWQAFLDADEVCGLGHERKRLFNESLFLFQQALSEGDAGFFRSRMKVREHWRLFRTFRSEAVCLDIETNGLQPGAGGYVTMVGLYDGFDYRPFVRGRNLSAGALADALSGYRYLITFYGAAFDIPFLFRDLGPLPLRIPHFDLCFGARKLQLRGGLKKLEKEMGICREGSVQGMTGYDAVLLWQRAEAGDSNALDLLIRYNREDTVNLLPLADMLYDRLRSATGIEDYLACRA